MIEVQTLLDLPMETLAALASGYIGYLLAYTGKDATHMGVDVIFLTFVFAALAKLVSVWFEAWVSSSPNPATAVFWVAVLCLLSVVIAAALWRRFGEVHVFNTLRKLKVSDSDRYQTAWETITLCSGVYPSQLIVREKDGSAIMSERLDNSSKAPFGPCVFGSDGSIAQ